MRSIISCWIVAFVLAPSRADAWDFDEHARLGEESYAEACAELRPAFERSAHKQQFEIACGERGGSAPRLASLYGQSTAIAADELASPEAFLNPRAAEFASSFLEFLALALRNESHFMPSAYQNWRHFHEVALVQATTALGAATFLEQQRLFEQAFYTQAFGDHFLQDSFSAGHSGFARVASRASVAGWIHDFFNNVGRVFIDARGRTWFGMGDGHLADNENFLQYQLVRAATRDSVLSFLLAFVGDNVGADRRSEAAAGRTPLVATGFYDWYLCGGGSYGRSGALIEIMPTCSEPKPEFSLVTSVQLAAEPGRMLQFSLASTVRPVSVAATVDYFPGSLGGMMVGLSGGGIGVDANHALVATGLVLDVPLYRRFPLPVSFDLAGRGYLLSGRNGSWTFGVRAALSLDIVLDVNKGWATIFSGGSAFTSHEHDDGRVSGFAPYVGFAINRVMGVKGGGHRAE